ncbi:MAG: iron-sulfur cluster assembly accessory protein [Rickettsiaceae bacterium]|nr:MAG: iron-sulfur cluster assembly accessory protein [Rickettsiaceae bacterium]
MANTQNILVTTNNRLNNIGNNVKNIISLTKNAIKQVKILLNKRGKSSLGIRIGIKTGGCSGKTYCIEYADIKNTFDTVIEIQGVKILIDPKALMYLIGAVMDYKEENFKSGFIFTNPNEKGNCGCGKSFNA